MEIKHKKILKLEAFDWNKLPKAKQDKALLFMYRVLHDLEKNRKYGYGDKFWAQYP